MSLISSNKIKGPLKKQFKLFTVILSILIILSLFVIAINTNLIDFSSNDNKEYDSPKIISAKTIDNTSYNTIDSIVLSGEDPTKKIEFEREEQVGIFYSFTNIIHDNYYNIIEMISIYQDNSLIDYYSEFSGSSSEESMYDTYIFKTNESTPLGVYIIDIILYDNITGKSASKSIGFVLKEKSPEILILTTASEVNGYQNYTQKTNFTQQEQIYIYTEYTDIQTTNQNTQCNLQIKWNITQNQTEYYNIELNKTELKNNAHYWEVITDITWPLNEKYFINFCLTDKITNQSSHKKTSFTLSEKTPEILILTTASEVNGYQNYTQKTNFTQQEQIYIYTEYTDIQTTNQNTQCNLYIKMNITQNQTIIYKINLNKTEVKNNAHYWEIIPEYPWENNTVYTVNMYLYDRNIFKNVESQTFFRIV